MTWNCPDCIAPMGGCKVSACRFPVLQPKRPRAGDVAAQEFLAERFRRCPVDRHEDPHLTRFLWHLTKKAYGHLLPRAAEWELAGQVRPVEDTSGLYEDRASKEAS